MIKISPKNNWLIEQTSRSGNLPFIKTNKRVYTYEGISNKVSGLAEYLLSNGIKKQERVSVISEDKLEVILTVLSLWQIGAVPVIINLLWKSNEVNSTLLANDIHKTIVQENILERTRNLDSAMEQIQFPEVIPNSSTTEHAEFELSNEALILFTSGSTSAPKGVVFTFSNIHTSVKDMVCKYEHTTDDTWLASLPLYHIGGFQIFTRSLLTGCSLFIPDSNSHDELSKHLLNDNISYISLVPTQLVKFLIDKVTAPKTLKKVFLGGAPASNGLIKMALDLGWNIVKVYGSTETSSMITSLDVSEDFNKIESVGRPFENVGIEIDGKEGEVLIDCDSIAKGYLIDSNITPLLHDGFYHTGDIGYIDFEGFLYITDRLKRIIISGGENISAYEIEKIINEHYLVLESFVFADKDDKWGEVPAAALVFEEDDRVDVQAVEEFLKEKLPTYKVPKRFVVLYSLPRNEMGKIDIPQLMRIINSD